MHHFKIDDQYTDVTGFTMRKAAVILPDLGTSPEMPIVVSYWFVGRGETVWEGERLVEVLVGPATFDIAAPATGRLVEIRMSEDDTLAPGAMLGCIAVLDEDSDDDSSGEPDPGSDDHDRDPRDRPRRSGHRSP